MAEKKKISKKLSEEKVSPKTKAEFSETLGYQIWPVVLLVLSLLLAFFYIFESASGSVGAFVRNFLFGMFSWGALLVPVILIKQVITWKSDVARKSLLGNFIYYFVTVLLVSVLAHSITVLSGNLAGIMNLGTLYKNGSALVGGGAIGGWLSAALASLIGTVPTLIIALAALIVFAIFTVGLTPIRIGEIISEKVKEKAAERARIAEQHREEARKKRIEEQKALKEHQKEERRIKSVDVAVESNDEAPTHTDEEGVIIESVDDIPLTNTPETETEDAPQVKLRSDGSLDLEEIFVNKENLELTRKMFDEETYDPVVSEAELVIDGVENATSETSPVIGSEPAFEEEEPEEHEYQFPPISFLAKGKSELDGNAEDLNRTANKLVQILESFGVKTSVLDVSKGPTVTRYELMPQAGVKVRTIGNLVDDIALHLGAVGAVRIEAPIPGKSAVGIEVPNQVGSMVALRDLIETPAFADSKSKVTTALGEDVAGNPIFMNIVKMPHLLIAGATGMGKSVCINSLIVSILYKATPDEVKLILIDPKKVELNVYNGIPHLIVPVVSEPKKAAGALCWAVSEMERRFVLIEECGERNIEGYNAIAENDPDLEKMPQIVIIIDELADLMMTAPGDVETSICRLAQKARAAGMHLIIGTQRPSVDVITGLIKANIPSRIAFTVASQIDSRTIIDIAGAEKLCGKGDMLYAPVGIAKPLRVQGSFVSTAEVERVCEFLKNHSDAVYDDDVANTIEQEAAKCGLKGKEKAAADADGSGVDADTSDEMLPKAIELAVEAGENGISTSMLQRRLAIGYARAGRIIDTMEKMGIIGGFEGSKPRRVLITREQFLEMRLGDTGAVRGSEE